MISLLKRYILKRYDTISFDIFDTLIVRDVCDPRDIFELVGKKFFSDDVELFVSNRIKSEKRAREQNKNNEVNLNDIYQVLSEYYPQKNMSEVKRYEENTEISSVKAREEIVDLYLESIAAHKKVYLISDMYLSETTITKMLQKCGISGFEKMYISNYYGVSKANGFLFNIFINENDIYCKKHIHVGDSFRSDFLSAKRKRMSSLLIHKKNRAKRLVNTFTRRYE